jgi:hypothetical protein
MVESMFDGLVAGAARAGGVASVGAWARVENAAAARRLAASADVLERQLAADGSAEREQWVIDNWDGVCAEIAAAQQVSLGVASHQLMLAMALRERLPRVGEVFSAGQVNLRVINAIVYRTALIQDAEARAKVDTEIAAAVRGWGSLSAAKLETAIDYWVDRYDPYALRRIENAARDRHVDINDTDNGTGLASVEARLLGPDGAALDKRLDAMADTVCAGDPRTVAQRRADALGALGHGGDRLVCGCDNPDCEGGGQVPSAMVVHVVAHEESLVDDSVVQLDGAPEPGPSREQLASMTITEALRQPEPTGTAATAPAVVMGAGMVPAPLLAAKLAHRATIVPIIHPGDSPPEPRYAPSAALATFVRCRDLTCRFPGCDAPADVCDLDHTIPYPMGPTQASNLKCLCRKHHLLKTFCDWSDRQCPDGTVVWTSPTGQTYTTHPGSRLLFPTLCRPTAVVAACGVSDTEPHAANRGLMMPRRKITRAQDRAKRIQAERARNKELNDNPVNPHRPENGWGDPYSLSLPPPIGQADDPPPF